MHKFTTFNRRLKTVEAEKTDVILSDNNKYLGLSHSINMLCSKSILSWFKVNYLRQVRWDNYHAVALNTFDIISSKYSVLFKFHCFYYLIRRFLKTLKVNEWESLKMIRHKFTFYVFCDRKKHSLNFIMQHNDNFFRHSNLDLSTLSCTSFYSFFVSFINLSRLLWFILFSSAAYKCQCFLLLSSVIIWSRPLNILELFLVLKERVGNVYKRYNRLPVASL